MKLRILTEKRLENVPVNAVSDNYVRRNIRFSLRPLDKDGYEKSLEYRVQNEEPRNTTECCKCGK